MRFGLSSVLLILVGCLDTKQAQNDNPDEAEIIDVDEDGFGPEDGDCDDSNPDIHPDAIEICDNIDNNCDSQIDEGMLKWSWEKDGAKWDIAQNVGQVIINIDDR